MTRAFAFLIGVLAFATAIGIVIDDAGWPPWSWSLDQKLMPILIIVTVALGHLLGSAIRQRRWAMATGFLISFSIATALSIVSSVVRQTESRTSREEEGRHLEEKFEDTAHQLRFDQRLFNEAREKLAACKDDNCIAIARKRLSDLRSTSPQSKVVEAPKLRTNAGAVVTSVLDQLGVPSERVGKIVNATWAFWWSLTLELTTIFCLGFSLGPTVVRPTRAQPPSPPVQPMNTGFTAGPAQLPSPMGQPIKFYEDAQPLIPRLLAMADQGVIVMSQADLAEHLALSNRKMVRATLRELESRGLIQLDTSPRGTKITIDKSLLTDIDVSSN